jgi:hypothetical protein
LDAEYASLARQVVAKLARKRPSPLLGGRRVTWAAAVVCALGQVNFLSDSSSEPHRTADELSAAFGVAKTTMGSKAKQVRDMLKLSYLKPEFLRADVIAENPVVWFIEVDGLPMDARSLPLDLQAVAFQRGYIPCIRPSARKAPLPSCRSNAGAAPARTSCPAASRRGPGCPCRACRGSSGRRRRGDHRRLDDPPVSGPAEQRQRQQRRDDHVLAPRGTSAATRIPVINSATASAPAAGSPTWRGIEPQYAHA